MPKQKPCTHFWRERLNGKEFYCTGCLARTQIEASEPVKEQSMTPEPTIEVINIKIDPTKTFDELVVAGEYDWENSNIIEKNFPLGPIPEGKELVRVRFNRYLPNRDAVINERKKFGLEPVTSIAFILTVGAGLPDLQKEDPINDIDSVWSRPGGHVDFPYLWCGDDTRALRLRWYGRDFGASEWVLALRNITPKS